MEAIMIMFVHGEHAATMWLTLVTAVLAHRSLPEEHRHWLRRNVTRCYRVTRVAHRAGVARTARIVRARNARPTRARRPR